MNLIEPYAGIGAYTVRAMGMEAERVNRRRYRLEPPVSRMGSKAGFAAGVFRAFGLTSARWSGFWLNDLDPVCGLVHMVYASSELREAVARRIWAMVPCPECHPMVVAGALRGVFKPTPESMLVQWQTTHADWIGREDKCSYCNDTGTYNDRRLWERLRKEAVPGGVVDAAAVGLVLQARTYMQAPVVLQGDKWGMSRVDTVSTVTFKSSEMGGIDAGVVASRLESLAPGYMSLADVVEAAARAFYLQSRSFQLKPVSITSDGWETSGWKPEVDTYERKDDPGHRSEDNPRWTLGERLEQFPPAGQLQLTQQDAALCLPTGDSSDCVVILDPPYEATSGYASTSCRADVLMLARAWSEAGALVLLHEACPLADELGKGWQSRSASILRANRSTFWKGEEREWLTFNRSPVWWPSEQIGMGW